MPFLLFRTTVDESWEPKHLGSAAADGTPPVRKSFGTFWREPTDERASYGTDNMAGQRLTDGTHQS
jgi:hypothetical protein